MGTRLIIIDQKTSFITKTNKKSKMQIPIFKLAFSVCFLAIFQIFVTSSDNVVEPEAGSASAAPDQNQYATPDQNQYANAYQVYQHWAQQQQQHPIHHKPPPTLNPFKILKNRQDSFAGDIEAFFGPDAGTLLGTLGAVLGSLALVGVGINAGNVGSLSTDQDSICTAVKTLGAIDVSSATTTDTTTGTGLNALITAIEAVSTPSC